MRTAQPQAGDQAEGSGEDPAGFADRLAAALRHRGVRQAALAKALGTRASTVSTWLRKPSWPIGGVLAQIAIVLDVDGHWLLTGQGHPDAHQTKASPETTASAAMTARTTLLRALTVSGHELEVAKAWVEAADEAALLRFLAGTQRTLPTSKA